MTHRFFTARALLLAVATIPVVPSAIHAQREPDELGYVDETGFYITWGPVFESAQAQSAVEAERRRRDYERCRNPKSVDGSRIFGDAVSILTGRRPQWDAFRAPRQAAPREDCGPPPQTGGMPAASIKIIDADARSSGRDGTIANFVFRSPGDNFVPGSQNLGGRCLALADPMGRLIAIRSKSEPDPYGFSNHSLPDPVAKLEWRVAQLKARISRREGEVRTARQQLASVPGYDRRSGSCATPARAALPPRPAALSDAEIKIQAEGSCVDLMMRRQDPAKVMAALSSVRQESMLKSVSIYRAKPAAFASAALYSQNEDFTLRMICAASDIACYGQMQTVIGQCVARVEERGSAPLEAWRGEVDAISRAPAEAKAQCSARLALADDSDLTALRAELEAAQGELAAARQTHVAQRTPLSQARCGG